MEWRTFKRTLIVHNPELSEGKKLFISSEGLEAKIVIKVQEEYEGLVYGIPEDLYVALTGLKKNSEEGKKLLDYLTLEGLTLNLEANIIKPENPEAIPVTLVPEKGRSPLKLVNYPGRETLFNLRYLKIEYHF